MNSRAGDATEQAVSGRILQPGRNCWCEEDASRISVIVDAAPYFSALAEALRAARKQILILGWDFDRRERLHHDDAHRDLPDELGAYLAALVRRRRDLNVYLLSWDFNMIYAVERELLPALRLRLQTPPRFHFRLDGKHPKGASHHQKVVVIDDRIAFVGGIDLSRWRWDTPEHKPDDPRRIDPDGNSYPPFHDIMMLVEGSAAARLGDLARQRWRRARGWKIKSVDAAESSPWPQSVKPQLHSQPVAIARTEPAYQGRPAVQEVAQLYLDAIAGARRFIYIENQYFTSRRLGDALSERLAERDGPEVVLVLPERTGGWLEQVTMDVLRGRVIERMQRADAYGRLRIYFPYQPGLADQCISVHAKLLIVDDRLLRIGSSNTSSRSMGLDTECDLAVEAQAEGDAVAAFIQDLRHRLLGEHLDCAPAGIAEVESDGKGLIGVIEALQSDRRSLRPLDCRAAAEIDDLVPDAGLIDPAEPFSPDYFVAEYVPKDGRTRGRTRLLVFLAVIVGLLGLAAAWRWTPLQDWLSPQRLSHAIAAVASPELRAVLAIGGVVLASLLMVPLTLLAVVAGIVFEGWQSFIYVMTGAVASSAIGFLLGQTLSDGAIERLSGSRLQSLSKRLARRGAVAVAVLRLVPIAPFAIFNLAAGASHLGFRQFLIGSVVGLAPGLGAITLFSNTLWEAIRAPSLATVAVTALVGGALVLFAWLMKRWLRSG
ncbi:MAG: VTT domain-containing protein [Chromatiaceae bacterium]